MNDHTSPTFIKERVIVLDTRKHPTTLTKAILAYAGATSSNVKFLLVENQQMEKNLQVVRKEAEKLRDQSIVSVMEEMRKVIMAKVSTLDTTMWKLYDGFVTVHKAVVCVHGLQQRRKEFVKTLRNIHDAISHVQE